MLALKLSLTPILILLASLAGRRWGETIGGWIVGLPLTSGPVAFFLTLDQGPAFAAQAAAGSLAGTTAEACFAVGYGLAATHMDWPLAFLMGAASFALAGAVLQALALPHLISLVVALAALTLGLRVLPSPKARRTVAALPAWDLPARMLVTTTLVVSVTVAAAALGPRLSGLLATFPIFAAVLTLFAHHIQGADAAHQVLRGLLLGLYGFAVFFIVLSQLLPRVSIAAAFVGAGLAAMLVQGVSFRMMRWGRSG